MTEFAILYSKIKLTCRHYSGAIPAESAQSDLTFVPHEIPLPPSNWIVKALLSFPQSIFASGDYDTNHLNRVEDLQYEPCILAHGDEQWLFRGQFQQQ